MADRCHHPPAETLITLCCRYCGVWEHGVRVGDFSESALVSTMKRAEGMLAVIHTDDEVSRKLN